MLDPHRVPVPNGHLDLLGAVAMLDGRAVRLSPVEAAVLSVLAEVPGVAVSEEVLLTKAWGYRTTNTRTVSMAMSRLRKKIERDAKSPQVLLTVRGEGYRLVPAAEESDAPARGASSLAGREQELARASELLERHGVLELVGVGGIGKTTLARAVLPDGVLVDLSDVRHGAALVRRLASALQAPGSDGLAAIRGALARRPRLLLDGGEKLDDEARAILRDLLGDTVTLVTTREPLGLGQTLVVDGLSLDGAIAVVAEAREGAGLPPVDDAVVARLRDAVGGHTMSLALAAPLVELGMAPDEVLQVPAASGQTPLERIRQTVDGLAPPLRALLDVLAAFRRAPIRSVGAVAERPLPALLHGVHELRVRGLVEVNDGCVSVHAFVRVLGVSDDSRARHAAWLAGHGLDPSGLRAVRGELEQALPHARGDRLGSLLLRHLFVILTYGPGGALRREVSPWLSRLPDDGRRDVLWGMTLFNDRRIEGAVEALLSGAEAVASGDHPHRDDWLAIAWSHISFCTSWHRDMDLAARARGEMAVWSARASDPTAAKLARMTLAMETAATQPTQSVAAFREIEQAEDSPLEWQFLALVSRLRLVDDVGRAEVLRAEALLEQLGVARLGTEAVSQRWIHIAQLWVCLGGHERAEELVATWAPIYAQRFPEAASRHVLHAVLYALAHPELARRLLRHAPEPSELRDIVVWLLAPDGAPPTADAELAALAQAYVDGVPVPRSERQLRVSMALRHAQGRPPP